MNDIKKLSKLDLVEGFKLDSNAKPDPVCEPCLAGKMHSTPFPSSDTCANEVLDLIHSDVHDVGVASPSGYRYWITFIDDKSRFRAVLLLKKKSEAFGAFKQFKAWAERVTGRKIRMIRHDKGGEYISKEFEQYLKDCGIEVQRTARNRPQQNGVAERANRTMEELLTAVLKDSGLPRWFWAECLAALVYVWNWCPTAAVVNSTPYQLWYKAKPKVDHLRVWGCVAYVHVQKDKRVSLGWHMEKCIFIGYPDGVKGWKFWNPETKKVVISERADFDERYTYGSRKQSPPIPKQQKEKPKTSAPHYYYPEHVTEDEDDDDADNHNPPPVNEIDEQPNDEEVIHDHGVMQQPVPEVIVEPPPVDPAPIATRKPVRNRKPPGEYWKVPTAPEPEVAPAPVQAPGDVLRRSGRTRKPPGEFWKLAPVVPAPGPAQNPVVPPATPEPDSDDEGSEGYEGDGEAGNVTQSISIPKTYKQAVTCSESDEWLEAMLEEMTAHLTNGTWELVDLPPGRVAIGSKWIYTLKHKLDGSLERFKARLVAQGFSQRPGFDFDETFASTMRWSTLRIILALAAIEDLELRTVDISHAFTNGDIDTEIYMKQPEGFKEGGPEKVCRLNKSLYGLKQSPRLWSEKLTSILAQLGFKRLESDPCVYMYCRNNLKVIVPVWVDDITLVSSDSGAIDHFVEELKKHLKLRDLGCTSHLLGMSITRDRSSHKLWLSSKPYILRKLDEFGMNDCKPVGTPMEPGCTLSRADCPQTPEEAAEMKNYPYMTAVGSLLFLALLTRPDIAFAVGVLVRFNSNPGLKHWKAVKRVFRYLKGTIDLQLEYGPDPKADDLITILCDADFGGNKDNGKSTTGYMVKVGSGVVSWCSKLQPIVTLSSTEAEFVAANAAGKEICAIRSLLNELGYQVASPTIMWVDNQSSIQVAKNPEHHGRMKHLDRSYYWLRDKVTHQVLMPMYIPTEDNAADMLTKSLVKPKVELFRGMMGLVQR